MELPAGIVTVTRVPHSEELSKRTFPPSDWAAERTAFPGEVAEAALAHTVSSKVEAAYRRGDLFEKRGKLMDAWARFCEPHESKGVVGYIG